LSTLRILGTGSYVPDRVVTNEDLIAMGIETSDDWIVRRTGIHERRFADPGTSTPDLGVYAAERALEASGLQATDMDRIIFCTLSPDRAFPGCGVTLQERLQLPQQGCFIPCIDLRAQCSGFLYGLSDAYAAIRAGLARRVLLVAAELQSHALDLTTRGRTVATLFGDGAGAVVLEGTDEGGIVSLRLGADGRYAEALRQDVWRMWEDPFVPKEGDQHVVPPEQLFAHMEG